MLHLKDKVYAPVTDSVIKTAHRIICLSVINLLLFAWAQMKAKHFFHPILPCLQKTTSVYTVRECGMTWTAGRRPLSEKLSLSRVRNMSFSAQRVRRDTCAPIYTQAPIIFNTLHWLIIGQETDLFI